MIIATEYWAYVLTNTYMLICFLVIAFGFGYAQGFRSGKKNG